MTKVNVNYECEFCGTKFHTRYQCDEHERNCPKNVENLPIKKITFEIDLKKGKIDSKVTNIDFTNGKDPETGKIQTNHELGYGFFKSEKEKEALYLDFKQYAISFLKKFIEEMKCDLKKAESFLSEISGIQTSNDRSTTIDNYESARNLLEKICNEKGINLIKIHRGKNKDKKNDLINDIVSMLHSNLL